LELSEVEDGFNEERGVYELVFVVTFGVHTESHILPVTCEFVKYCDTGQTKVNECHILPVTCEFVKYCDTGQTKVNKECHILPVT